MLKQPFPQLSHPRKLKKVKKKKSQAKSKVSSCSVNLNPKLRKQLQSGDASCLFDNKQLVEVFTEDLKRSGVSNPVVNEVPDGEVSFIFCKVKGRKSAVQVFIDPGCNCAIMRDGIPQNEFNAVKLRSGPIGLDVATGIQVNAESEWGINIPLANGSYQVVKGLSVKKVTSDMPKLNLKSYWNKLKAENPKLKNQNLSIPEKLGGEIDMILGIQFNMLHPDILFQYPNGLTVYKSRLMPANANESVCIGGPMTALKSVLKNRKASSSIRFLSHLMINISNGNYPRLEYFPGNQNCNNSRQSNCSNSNDDMVTSTRKELTDSTSRNEHPLNHANEIKVLTANEVSNASSVKVDVQSLPPKAVEENQRNEVISVSQEAENIIEKEKSNIEYEQCRTNFKSKLKHWVCNKLSKLSLVDSVLKPNQNKKKPKGKMREAETKNFENKKNNRSFIQKFHAPSRPLAPVGDPHILFSTSRPFPSIGKDVPVMSPVPIDDVLEPVQSKKESTRRKRKTKVKNLGNEIELNSNFNNAYMI